MDASNFKIKTNDKNVRERLVHDLLKDRRNIGVLGELEIAKGRVRADVVSISNTGLNAYEIKSDIDNLSRLPRQQHYYSRIFSTVTLVVGQHHAAEALYEIPDWWGVDVAVGSGDGVHIYKVRTAKHNAKIDYDMLKDIFRKDELLSLLRANNLTSSSYAGMSKPMLVEELEKSFPIESLMSILATTLSVRRGLIVA